MDYGDERIPTFEHEQNWYAYTNKLATGAGVYSLNIDDMEILLFAEVPYSVKLDVLGEL